MSNQAKIKITISTIILVACGVLVFIFWPKNLSAPINPDGKNQAGVQFEYKNLEYGFSISLPESWRGYTVGIDKWTGYASGDQLGEVAFADGPVVSIHNPKWTKEVMYQDIPVMVFTIDQWSLLQQEKFHIGAAPIGPSELGRNAKYVFALPARYNYSFPLGYEEVEQIIQSKPLRAF